VNSESNANQRLPYRHDDIDRWFYLFMVLLIAAVSVVGFAPNTAAVLTERIESPPLIIHFHAATMAGWLIFLVCQGSLFFARNKSLHKSLGWCSVAFVPVIVVGFAAASIINYGGANSFFAGIVLIQLAGIIYFPLFYVLAFRCRKSDLESHKRFIIMAMVPLLGAAFGRISWFPRFGLPVIDFLNVSALFILVPAFIYDFLRFGRIHKAYLLGLGMILPAIIMISVMTRSDWWLSMLPKIMGS
jgi:hypothetical protein